VTTEFAVLFSAVGFAAILGGHTLAPEVHDYVLRAEASIVEARQALIDTCGVLASQEAGISACPVWALHGDDGERRGGSRGRELMPGFAVISLA
jgi:hypothetical protein